MTSLLRRPLCAVASAFLSSTILFAQQTVPAVRITSPINASQLVTLKGSVNPLANAQNDRGAAAPNMQLDRMHLILKRSPAQDAALRQLIQDQNTPGSPNYHKWLTPAQFGAQFGPSDQDLATVQNWLASQGFTVDKIEPGRQTLDISGTVAQLGTSFHTQIRKYMVNGRLHYANANDPSIPAALAPVVGGFVSLNNFPYHSYAQQLGHAAYDPSTGLAKPSWTIGGGTAASDQFVLSPADFAVQYDLPSTLKGDGQTIAIVNESNINIDLVNQFRSLFGLSSNPPQVIIDGNDPGVDGINNPDGPNYASVEAYLDVEWAGAVAPNATIDLVVAADTSLESGLALAAEHAVYSNIAPVVSVSFGGCELQQGSSNVFWNNLWQQAAAQGQTVIVSTGDSGSAGCDYSGEYASNGLGVNGIASTPYNVAVGGTDFYYSSWNQGTSAIDTQLGTYWSTAASNTTPTASIQKYIPEQPWNSSQYGLDLINQYSLDGSTTISAGSGGASSAAICSGTYGSTFSSINGYCSVPPTGYPKPSWQSGTGVPSDKVRDIPDVSLFASNGYNDSYYPICATDGDCQSVTSGTVQIFGVGGTSASAPAFAGIMALVNQKYGRQGQADTILYPLKAQFPAAFHDVTNGTNSVPCAFSATTNLNTPNCIQIAGTSYVTVNYTDSNGNPASQLEGEIGTGTTADYNAAAGYNLATGLGTVDANALITDWASVQLPSASVTFNATPTSIPHGSSVTVSGAVTGSGTPTGNVAILSDSPEPSQQGQQVLTLDSSGKYSGSISTLPGGSYNIWASYGGDTKNGAQISSKIPITVNPEASGIAFGLFENGSNQYLAANQTTSIYYGTQLMLSARVAPSADVATIQACTPAASTTKCPTGYTSPTGSIVFKDSSSTLNTAVINSEGDAEYNAPFSVGSHSVSATYSGDNSYNASSAGPITFTIAQDSPSLFIAASNQVNCSSGTSGFCVVSGANQPTVVNILVENSAQVNANNNSTNQASFFPVPVAAPTGTVSISGLPSGVPTSASLSAGVDPTDGAQVGIATFNIPATTSQTSYKLTISYSGDTNYTSNIVCGSGSSGSGGTNAPQANCAGTIQALTSTGITTQTAASMSGSISPSSTITITGTVTATSGSTAPTGQVYLFSSGNYLTSTTLTAGSVTAARNTQKGSLWPAAGGAIFAAALFFWIPKRRRSWLAMFVMLAFLVSISGIACGGGGGSSSSGGSGSGGGGGGTGGGGGGSTGSGGTAKFTFVVSSQVLVQGANYLTVQYAGTNATPYFLPSAVNVNSGNAVSNPLSDFSIVPVTSMQQVAVNGSSNDTINVSSINGFSGGVTLSCSAPSAVTCSVTQPSSLTAGASTTATLTINAASGTAAGNYPVAVTGKAGEYIHTLAITAAVR
jgi:hypothetical protein